MLNSHQASSGERELPPLDRIKPNGVQTTKRTQRRQKQQEYPAWLTTNEDAFQNICKLTFYICERWEFKHVWVPNSFLQLYLGTNSASFQINYMQYFDTVLHHYYELTPGPKHTGHLGKDTMQHVHTLKTQSIRI